MANQSIESRLKLLQLGLILCPIGALGSALVISHAKARGFNVVLPHHFLLFDLASWAYAFCFLLWLLKRSKKKSN